MQQNVRTDDDDTVSLRDLVAAEFERDQQVRIRAFVITNWTNIAPKEGLLGGSPRIGRA